MSYIRSGSNPEQLYIWGEKDGRVYFSHNVKEPLATPGIFSIPRHIFEHVCLRWAKTQERVSRRGLIVEEVFVKPNKFLIRLVYNENCLHMYEVTWESIVNSVVQRQG